MIVKKSDNVLVTTNTLSREDSQLDLNVINVLERVFQIKIESSSSTEINDSGSKLNETTLIKTNETFLNSKILFN